jgi:hypothetical protein
LLIAGLDYESLGEGKSLKKIAVLMAIILFLSSFSAFAPAARSSEAPAVEWDKTYGGLDMDGASSLVQASDGGFAVACSTRSYGAGSSDFWLIKLAGPSPDVNHDGRIDIFDLVSIAASHGATPTSSNWSPHADIAQPFGKIDISDVVLCASQYGEKYP